jgi:hypothetical protein
MRRPYSVLLPVGFAVPFLLPARGALLPHHFDLTASQCGGMISVALSLELPQPDVIRHRSSLEPGLSSPTQLPVKRRSPNPLAGTM